MRIGLNVARAELLPDGPAMLMKDHARRLIEYFPSALPREKTEVGVFQIKGREQLIEAAQFEELRAIVSGRATACIEAREQPIDRGIVAMAHLQFPRSPTNLR